MNEIVEYVIDNLDKCNQHLVDEVEENFTATEYDLVVALRSAMEEIKEYRRDGAQHIFFKSEKLAIQAYDVLCEECRYNLYLK